MLKTFLTLFIGFGLIASVSEATIEVGMTISEPAIEQTLEVASVEQMIDSAKHGAYCSCTHHSGNNCSISCPTGAAANCDQNQYSCHCYCK